MKTLLFLPANYYIHHRKLEFNLKIINYYQMNKKNKLRTKQIKFHKLAQLYYFQYIIINLYYFKVEIFGIATSLGGS